MATEGWLTVEEAAAESGKSASTIRYQAKKKQFKTKKHWGRQLIEAKSFRKWLKAA